MNGIRQSARVFAVRAMAQMYDMTTKADSRHRVIHFPEYILFDFVIILDFYNFALSIMKRYFINVRYTIN